MTEKRFTLKEFLSNEYGLLDDGKDIAYVSHKSAFTICDLLNKLNDENKQLKSQLYYDEEEGVCNICKHHYLVSDDEAELGYYNSRCTKGHYECARISLKYCNDFELKGDAE